METRTYAISSIVDDLLGDLERGYAERGTALLAIPGGRSPLPVVTALATALPETVREALHLFWVDERAVPPGDPARNDAATLAAWRRGGPVPTVHPLPAGEPDLAVAARRYAALLDEVCGDAPFDAVLLGMGADGHVASLFPGHPALDAEEPVLVITDAPKPPPIRLTLSLPRLARADRIHLLVPDADKRHAFEAGLAATDPPPCLRLPRERLVVHLNQ